MLKELDRAWIAGHIPHRGSMCLLDAVETWDQERILCRASSHRAADNPLRARGRLGAACGVEYAAQAMAVHGALLAPAQGDARPGMLVSARSVQLHVDRLDDLPQPLQVRAERLQTGEDLLIYGFSLHSAGRLLLQGRVSVLLGPDTPPPAAAPCVSDSLPRGRA